ncbi:TSUP family transporter [Agrobacterium sp. ES01]|uniref:TSUP family transporter n=1 Tax=Agrobacterium sp. ES01 TaxID=3420714 RepID=UPI003D0C28B8
MTQDLLSSPLLLAAVFAIVVAAAIVQAGLGMGFGLTAAPLLALIDPQLVPAPTLFLGMITAVWGAWRERDAIVWSEVGLGVTGRLCGVFAATFVLAALPNRDTFTLLFGLMIAAAVLLSVIGWKLVFNRTTLLAMSVISGLLGTITSVGAPPLALIYQDRSPAQARPTLSAFFAIGCILSLGGLYVSGWAGLHDLMLAALMLPPMLLGTFIARQFGARFDKRFRPALLAVSAAAALILILRGAL